MTNEQQLHARVLAIFRSRGDAGASMKELVHELGEHAPGRQDIRRTLKTLCRRGDLVRVERDLYCAPSDGGTFQGELRYEQNRFQVTTPKGVVEIPASTLHDAIAGDIISGRLTSDGIPAYGIVESVVEARAPRKFTVQVSRFRGMVIGDSEEIPEPVQVLGELPPTVRIGSYMEVTVVDRRPFTRGRARGFPSHVLAVRHPEAEVAVSRSTQKEHMLRFVDPESVDAREVLDQLARGLGVDEPFSDAAIAQAEAGRAPQTADEYGDDLTGVAFCTIDGADAKDFDDAVFAEEIGDDTIRLWVAVADVSSYVEEGSELDEEARRRGCSVYLPDRVYPMLPHHLADDVCSLRPDALRRCAWVSMDVEANGRIGAHRVGFGTLRSRARLTYAQVHAFLQDGATLDAPDEVRTGIRLLEKVRARRWNYRRRRGMLDLDLPEPQVTLSEDGREVQAIEPYPRWESNRLIEECMLAANETVAGHILRAGWPQIYRVHGDPDPRKLADLRRVLRDVARDVKVPDEPTARDLEKVLQSVAGTERSRVLSWLVLRVLPRAEYAVERQGHFGLGADLYVHFTSPIRRYPDLEIHRILRRVLQRPEGPTAGERETLVSRLVESAQRSNAGEAVQTTAERTSDRMMRTLYMRSHVGDRFKAVVSDVARFGLFVSVSHPYVEGLVPIRTLGKDYFEVDERRARLVGERTRTTYQVGDELEVICTAVDVRQGNITFELTGSKSLRDRSGAGRPTKARRSGPKRRRR